MRIRIRINVKSLNRIRIQIMLILDSSGKVCELKIACIMPSSLGRYVFGSEISYNKPPPRLPGLGC